MTDKTQSSESELMVMLLIKETMVIICFDLRRNINLVISQLITTRVEHVINSILWSSSRQDLNPMLWLTTQAAKIRLSCPLQTTHHVSQEKSVLFCIINPLLTINLIWPRWQPQYLCFYGLRQSQEKRTWPISSHLDVTFVNNPY